jgi:threonine dehydrogenase-like Zn-dependent dehydrogenase
MATCLTLPARARRATGTKIRLIPRRVREGANSPKGSRRTLRHYTKPLLEKIQPGLIDTSFVVTHPASLEDAPEMYKKFRDKEDGVIKVVLRP